MNDATIFDRDGWVGSDPDDLDYVNKLADNVGVVLDVEYDDPDRGCARRLIEVDGVFGEDMLAPRFLRAHDLSTGARCLFAVSAVKAIHLDGGVERGERVPWFIGHAIRVAAGEPKERAPFSHRVDLAATVRIELDGRWLDVRGVIVRAEVRYAFWGVRAFFTVRPDEPIGGSRRARRVRLLPDNPGLPLAMVCDGAGLEIGDVYGWLAKAGGLTVDGWPR